MSEAPDRIWACVSKNTKSGVVTLLGDATFPVDGWQEYVRVDRLEAQAAEIERLVREKKWIMEERDRTFALVLARAEMAEAKLEKAVEALEAFKEFDDLPTAVKRPDLFEIKVRRTILRTLAELKGDMTDDPVKQALAELQDVVRCRCHPAYTGRGLHDPDCECDSAEALKVVSDRIEELEAKLEKLKDKCREAISVEDVLEILDDEGWLGKTRERIELLKTGAKP